MSVVSRRIVTAVFSIALASFILAACIQVEVESEFESDGSATHSITTSVDRSIMDADIMGEQAGGEIDFEGIRQAGEAAGFEVEEIDTADRVGARLSTHVDDNEDLSDVMNQLFAAAGGEGPPVGGFEGGFSESDGFGGSSFRFELTVDGNALFENQLGETFDEDLDEELDDQLEDEFGADLDMDLDAGMMRQLLNMSYTVSLPGETTEHNGTDLGGGRVQWDIPLEGAETFFAESDEGSGFSMALIIGVALGAIALILLIVGLTVLMRPKKAPTQAPPAGNHSDETTRPVD